ncbi:MAG TPA: hypothetical protein VGI06_13575, partial [Acidimicrobiales bacterium]
MAAPGSHAPLNDAPGQTDAPGGAEQQASPGSAERGGSPLGELRRMAPYRLYQAGALVARGLPGRPGEAAAALAGVAAGRLTRRRRAMMGRHLTRIGGVPASEAAVDRAFASYGRYWLESFRMPWLTGAQLEAGMCYEGIGHLEVARGLGRGVVMAMPHLGAWDWGGAWLAASGFPVTVVA